MAQWTFNLTIFFPLRFFSITNFWHDELYTLHTLSWHTLGKRTLSYELLPYKVFLYKLLSRTHDWRHPHTNVTGHYSNHRKDMLYSALEAFGYETESFQPMSETGRSGHLIQEKDVDQSEDYGQTYNAVLKGIHTSLTHTGLYNCCDSNTKHFTFMLLLSE